MGENGIFQPDGIIGDIKVCNDIDIGGCIQSRAECKEIGIGTTGNGIGTCSPIQRVALPVPPFRMLSLAFPVMVLLSELPVPVVARTCQLQSLHIGAQRMRR